MSSMVGSVVDASVGTSVDAAVDAAVGAAVSAAVSAKPAAQWLQFICRVCGLIYDERTGDADSGLAAGTRWADIPDNWACPICGVGKADFEPYVAAQVQGVAARATLPVNAAAHRPDHAGRRDDGVVIVGAGRAGWAVAQALRAQGWTQPIKMVSACAGDVYDKPQLSVAVMRGLDPASLVRESASAAATRLQVRLRCATHAVAIEAPARRLRTTRGPLRFQHLVLAQGAEPALPAVLPAALVWRINDLLAYQRLRAALAAGPQRLVIVGAGLVGCELANDLALAGHTVTLVDVQTRPLAAQLPAIASQRLLQAWQGLAIEFIGGVQVAGVAHGDESARAGATSTAIAPAVAVAAPLNVALKDGRVLAADHVIAATGLRAADRLARTAGLAFDSAAGGIVVSAETGATSARGIHALGDCVVVNGQASRYIEPIAGQARAIAAHIMQGVTPVALATLAKATSAQGVMPAPPPMLRVKTSRLPITVTGGHHSAGRWRTELDTPKELRLVCLGAQGERLATLVARVPLR